MSLSLSLLAQVGCNRTEETEVDADADGFGASVDCDDANAAINPGATEVCDGVDNDCDGTIDVGATDASTFYADADGDGFGGGDGVVACAAPADHVALGGDCDDTNAAAYPGAPESVCTDPVDYNCDGSVGATDADNDGFSACEDCNDANAAINPGAAEACDAIDNDCDGEVDEAGASGESSFYADTDGDGFGDAAATMSACAAPAGHVANADDCDDAVAAISPLAVELCDTLDNDCDGDVDELGASGERLWFADADNDGFGAAAVSTRACAAPDGHVDNDDDCDDAVATVYPGAAERCNGVDDDCDTRVDEDAVDAPTWYGDADNDGHGGTAFTQSACAKPNGFVSAADDCDDLEPRSYPGAVERCDREDNDCDGAVGADEEDLDGDGFTTCEGDCNDADDLVGPSVLERCNLKDDDCDGQVDEDAVDRGRYYIDRDGDGFGLGSSERLACALPLGYVTLAGDCDDANSQTYPRAAERCDGVDNDCDGAVPANEADADNDGVRVCQGDCNDGAADVYPGAPERCNGRDDNCNGQMDENAVDRTMFYVDADTDGFGRPGSGALFCARPSDRVGNADDCDDTRVAVNPAATEVPGNGLDDDCDGNQGPQPAPLVGITPVSPSVTQNLVCRVLPGTSTADPDGDVVIYDIEWTVNGNPWTGATSRTDRDGDTISAANTALNQTWRCTVIPTDGFDDGPSGSAQVVISDWKSLANASVCTNWTSANITTVYCAGVRDTYAACQSFCAGLGSGSRAHWENNNGDYTGWGSAVAQAFSLCLGDTACTGTNDDQFWSSYQGNPQTLCSGGARISCASTWYTGGVTTTPTQCFCFR